MQTLLDAAQIDQILTGLAGDILADSVCHEPASGAMPLALIGIRSRGELLAQRLSAKLAVQNGKPHPVDLGALDITFYRDDLSSRRAITIPQGTEMNFRLDDRTVILVDDVLKTGRSVRAALDALVDFGRPKLIRLAVLIDRGGREFPIAADYVGLQVPETEAHQQVVVRLKPTDTADAVYLADESDSEEGV